MKPFVCASFPSHPVLWLGGVLLGLASVVSGAQAQGVIYRCGNEYTNVATPAEAKARGCKTMAGGNITVVEGTKVSGGAAARAPGSHAAPATASPASPAAAAAPKVSVDDQRARDNNARAILDAELRRTETRLAELRKEYNDGEPEKLGPETRNHQKYLDRVAELKANIARAEDDIAGIKRELGRIAPRGERPATP